MALSCETDSEPRIAILTDLDGTLLDHETYSFEPARHALDEARLRGWPVIFCSSKTRAEIEAIRTLAEVRDPFISENGGAVFIPPHWLPYAPPAAKERDGYWVVEMGWPHDLIIRRMRSVREEAGLPIRGFSDMTLEEIAEKCGLELEAAKRAASREYDEPFEILSSDGQLERFVVRKLEQAGLFVSAGGRFYHLTGPSNKGRAAVILIGMLERQYPHFHSLALGDAANDLPLLLAAELCAIVKRGGEDQTAAFRNTLPHALFPSRPGPWGWSEVVGELLEKPARACELLEAFSTV